MTRSFCIRAACIVIAATAPAGCLTYAAAGLGTVAAGSAIGAATSGSSNDLPAVRVRMSRPQEILLVAKDTVALNDVQSLIGRVVAERGDTVTVAVSEASGLRGRQTFPHSGQHTTTLVRSSAIEIAVLSTNPRRKQRAVLGGIFAGVAFVAATLFALRGMT